MSKANYQSRLELQKLQLREKLNAQIKNTENSHPNLPPLAQSVRSDHSAKSEKKGIFSRISQKIMGSGEKKKSSQASERPPSAQMVQRPPSSQGSMKPRPNTGISRSSFMSNAQKLDKFISK